MTRPNEPTAEGGALIRRMVEADRQLQDAKARVGRAIQELAEATNAVGEWLIPKDAKPNETFQIPYQDAFLQMHTVGVGRGDFKASWRNNKKPRRF